MRVSCVVESIPSYMGHMLSIARVGFESEYSDRYSQSVKQEDINWLKENEELLKWGNGKAGPLTGYGLFMLGYVNPDGPEGIESYYNSLLAMAKNGDMSQLFHFYPRLERFHEIWGPLNDPRAIEMLRALGGEIEQLKKVFVENWDCFLNEVWPQEKPKVIAQANVINKRLQEVNLIDNWENATGFTFQSDSYEYILSSGMKNGPRFNSLGYGRNWVYYDTPFLLEGIVHEIGSHLLMRLQGELQREYDFSLLYNVYETLCSFLTKMIFSDLGISITPVDNSKLYFPRAHELFEQKIQSLPISDLRGVFKTIMDQIISEKGKGA